MTALKVPLILLVLAFSKPFLAKDRPGIPVKLQNGSLVIAARIAGTPVRLLLDTGSNLTTVSPGLVPATSFKTVWVHTMNGDRTASLSAAEVTVGDQSREEIIQLIERRNLPHGVDGILGLKTLLEMCDVFSIDFKKEKLFCH